MINIIAINVIENIYRGLEVSDVEFNNCKISKSAGRKIIIV